MNPDDDDDDDDDDGIAYFNNAGQARLTKRVQEVGMKQIQRRPWESTNDDQARIRSLFATMIDANDAKDISIMSSTSCAISLAAHNVEHQHDSTSSNHTKESEGGGGRILVLQDQYCSAVYPWQELCKRSHGKWSLEIVPHPTQPWEVTDNPIKSWTESIVDLMQQDDDSSAASQTKGNIRPIRVACLPPLHWSNGALLDLPRISKICHQQGILLIVDATQAVGAMPCSIKSIRPAMLMCSVHKWLRSPPGASLVYINPALHATWQPLEQHGRNRMLELNYDSAKNVIGKNGYPDEFVADARKFDSGGRPNPLLIPMIRAAMEDVVTINVEELQGHLKKLMTPLIDWATATTCFQLTPGDHAYHLIGIEPTMRTAEEVVETCKQLAAENIHVMARCGSVRVSAYLDTTEADVQRLIEALDCHLYG